MTSPQPINSPCPHHPSLSRPSSFPSSFYSNGGDRLIPMSPMSNGSPSHISEPIHIQIPRRQLFSPYCEEASQDSGFDSPNNYHFKRAIFQDHPDIIYENIEEPVFKFDEEEQQQNLQAPQTLLIVASSSPSRPCLPSPSRRSISSPSRRSTVTSTSPASSLPLRFNSTRCRSSSVPSNENAWHHTRCNSVPAKNHHQSLMLSPYKSSATTIASNNSCTNTTCEYGRTRSSSGGSTSFFLKTIVVTCPVY